MSYLDANGWIFNTASYGAGDWQIDANRYDKFFHLAHKYTVNFVAVVPYAACVATRGLRRTSWGRQRNRRYLFSVERWGLYADMAIDRYKMRHNLGERSQWDEGPGSIVYWNPAHELTRHIGVTGPAWHNAPGTWKSHRRAHYDW
jgi:hypothetical protein